MKISVCIPMYNESAIIADTIKTLYKAMEKFSRDSGFDYEVIFSNDGSTDGCEKIAEQTASELGAKKFFVCGYEKNRGKGAAVRHAVLASTGDVVIYTDSDLAYGTDVILQAAQKFTEESRKDIVIGSRNISNDGYEGYTFSRKIASKAYIKVVSLVAGFRLSDSQCGFKAFRGDVARRVFGYVKTDGFAFDLEVLLTAIRLGYTIGEMPVKIVNHRESTVRMLSDSVKMLGDLKKIKKRVKKTKFN